MRSAWDLSGTRDGLGSLVAKFGVDEGTSGSRGFSMPDA